MGTLKRMMVVTLLAIELLLMLYLLARTIASLRQGYSWSEMDWDQKGRTTLMDFLSASDIGERKLYKAGQQCVEYYAYKDGLPVKTVCQKNKF